MRSLEVRSPPASCRTFSKQITRCTCNPIRFPYVFISPLCWNHSHVFACMCFKCAAWTWSSGGGGGKEMAEVKGLVFGDVGSMLTLGGASLCRIHTHTHTLTHTRIKLCSSAVNFDQRRDENTGAWELRTHLTVSSLEFYPRFQPGKLASGDWDAQTGTMGGFFWARGRSVGLRWVG